MQVKRQQLEPDMEQWPGSKLGKEYIKAVILLISFLCRVKRSEVAHMTGSGMPPKSVATFFRTH